MTACLGQGEGDSDNDGVRAPGSSPSSGAGRWLNEAELSRLFVALSHASELEAANLLRLMLVTAVGIPELLTARWSGFDFERELWLQPQSAAPGTWVKPRPRRIALSEAALVLLRGMRERAPEDEYLFPSGSGGELLGRVESAWDAAVTAAAIEDAQLQKLRPVLASGVFKGVSEPLLKRLLGVAPSASNQALR